MADRLHQRLDDMLAMAGSKELLACVKAIKLEVWCDWARLSVFFISSIYIVRSIWL